MSLIETARWIWPHAEVMRCNQYALFRRLVELPAGGPVSLQICADLRYWLYVNGRRVGFGPGRFHPSTPLYDTWDLDALVRPGVNVIAVKVHGIGPVNRCSSFMPRRCAMIAALSWPGGSLVTGRSWRALEETAYRGDTPRFANHQSFIECFDARLAQHGWLEADYDDSHWHDAHEIPADELAPWEGLAPRPVPLLSLVPRLPARLLEYGRSRPLHDPDDLVNLHVTVEQAERRPAELVTASPEGLLPLSMAAPETPGEAAYAVLDFGENAAGYLVFEVEGAPGTVIDVGHSEHLDEGRVGCAAQGVRYVDRFILGEGPLHHQLMMPKALRYLLLEVRGGSARFDLIRHDVSTCPVVWRGSFCAPEDPTLQRAWQLGAYTVQLCMEDVYMDTPRRERAGWLGDMLPEAVAAYYAFGETTVARHSLHQYMQSQHDDGAIIGRYPSNDGPTMPASMASYAPLLADYVRYSGDLDFAREMWPGVRRITGWFERQRTADDLVQVTPTRRDPSWGYGYILIDWAPIQLDGVVTPMVMFHYYYLREAAWLAALLGETAEAAELERLSERTREGIRRRLFDPERGLFANCLTEQGLSRRLGYHENLLALLWDIATPDQAAAIDANLLASPEEPMPLMTWEGARDYTQIAGGTFPWDDTLPVPLGSPFFEHFALEALFRTGRTAAAMANLRSHYGYLLSAGATTVWEDWAGDSSRSHGWGAAPTTLLGKYVLGVEPLTPGFRRFTVLPTYAGLKTAHGRVPTPLGTIQTAWRRSSGEAELTVLVPAGAEAVAGLPGATPLTVDGATVEASPLPTPRGPYSTVLLEPGEHRISGTS